jgi:hypothetical protein
MSSFVVVMDLDTADHAKSLDLPSVLSAPATPDVQIFRFDENVLFVRTALDITALTHRLQTLFGRPQAEFFIAELNGRSPYAGSLPPRLWDFLDGRSSIVPAA